VYFNLSLISVGRSHFDIARGVGVGSLLVLGDGCGVGSTSLLGIGGEGHDEVAEVATDKVSNQAA